MGQYHYICNLDKREYLDPHGFGDGLKLMEFGQSASGVMTGLALLLAVSNGPDGRGGGDWHRWTGGPGYEGREVTLPENHEALAEHIPGRWGGDRIAIIGDYREVDDIPGMELTDTPWSDDSDWVDISIAVVDAIMCDYYVVESYAPRDKWGSGDLRAGRYPLSWGSDHRPDYSIDPETGAITPAVVEPV